MNFDHVNRISDFCRDQIMPHLTNRMPVADFGNYLSKMVDSPSCKWMRSDLQAFPLNYYVEPVAFVKKYSKRCVAFVGTMNPQDGAFSIIYQISPTVHVLARMYHWIEQEKVRAYLMVTVAYKNQEDFLNFFDENKSLRLTGNTEERKTGFAAIQDQADMDNIFKGFAQTSKSEDVTEEERNRFGN